eukprot:gene178-791_t
MADLNEVLNEIYRKDVKLDPEQTQQLTGIFNNFLDLFCQTMKQVDPLFNLLFKNNIYHGGSYYDGLRIGEATKFDLNIILRFPFQHSFIIFDTSSITFDTSSVPGYAFVGLSRPVDQLVPRHDPDHATYREVSNFIGHNNKFMPEKVRYWFESVCAKAVNRVQCNRGLAGYNIKDLRLRKSGPALTLEIQPQQNLPMISVDLVPVIQSPDIIGDVTYCVPKPHQRNALLWRCSCPDREREFLRDDIGCAKMVIKLLKKMRDRQGWHCLASYYLKTVVMLCKGYAVWFQSKIGYFFIASLVQLSSYLDQRKIPFHHNHGCNLLENIDAATLENINGRLKRIIRDFQNCSNPAKLKKYFI